MNWIFIFVLLLISFYVVPQNYVSQKYFDFKIIADSLRLKNNFEEAAIIYNQAFADMGKQSLSEDRYNAARCWAYAGFKDSSYRQLQFLMNDVNFLDDFFNENDSAFFDMRNDKKWKEILKNINIILLQKRSRLNYRLIFLIDSMAEKDQLWRLRIKQLMNNELDTIQYPRAFVYKQLVITDSLNYNVCLRIIEQYGFPNYQLVGEDASNNFWLLIQHQDKHSEFQEKVASQMKIAVESDNASKINYAYLLDRIFVNKKQPQIYGTQLRLNSDSSSYIPYPVTDSNSLNERRKSLGMNTIEEYISDFNNQYKGSLKVK